MVNYKADTIVGKSHVFPFSMKSESYITKWPAGKSQIFILNLGLETIFNIFYGQPMFFLTL